MVVRYFFTSGEKGNNKLLTYITNFQQENIVLDSYEVLNSKQNSKFNSDFETDKYYLGYLEFVKKEKISKNVFLSFLNYVSSKDVYYEQYIKYDYIYYCIFEAVSIVNKNSKYLISTAKDIDALCVYIFVLIIESSELDTSNRRRISKKRIYNQLFDKYEYDYSKINKEFSRLDDLSNFFKRCCLTLEFILTRIGIVKGIIDYSTTIGPHMSTSNAISITIEDINNVEKAITNNNMPENSDFVKELLLDVVTTKKRYVNHGTRFVVFSIDLVFVKDINNMFFVNPPKIIGNIQQIGAFYYKKILYNIRNPHKSSVFFDPNSIVDTISQAPILFSKQLFLSVRTLFTKKYVEKHHKWNKNTYLSIVEALDSKFLTTDYLSLFFPYSIDFRGRLYIQSTLSITNVKLLRYIVSTADVTPPVQNYYYKQMLQYMYIIKNETFYSQTDENKNILMLVGFLNLGKLIKNFIKKEDNGIRLEQFILAGLELYKCEPDKLTQVYQIKDIDDLANCMSQRQKMSDFIAKNIPFNILIDSTASGIFHLSIWLLASKKQEKYVNLSDNLIWYDTYSYLLDTTLSRLRGEKIQKIPKQNVTENDDISQNALNDLYKNEQGLKNLEKQKRKLKKYTVVRKKELINQRKELISQVQAVVQTLTENTDKKKMLKTIRRDYSHNSDVQDCLNKIDEIDERLLNAENQAKLKKDDIGELREKKEQINQRKELISQVQAIVRTLTKNTDKKKTLKTIRRDYSHNSDVRGYLDKIDEIDEHLLNAENQAKLRKDDIGELREKREQINEKKKQLKSNRDSEIIDYINNTDFLKILEDYQYLFTRSRIKKLYMTLPYKAHNTTLFDYLTEGMNQKEKTLVRLCIFKPMIKVIRELFDKDYLIPLSKIRTHPLLSHDNFVINYNKTIFDFQYYKLTTKDTEATVDNHRNWFTTYDLLTVEEDGKKKYVSDKKKTDTAFTANVMHATDAVFLKNVVMACKAQGIIIHTIHDEFIVPVNRYFEVLEIMNTVFSNMYNEANPGYNKNYRAFFIVL